MFLNHRIDTALLFRMGEEFAARFKEDRPTVVLTVESSGIAMAVAAAHALGDIPVVFAKKSQSRNISNDVYTAKVESFTHGKVYDVVVSKEYLNPGDKILLIDDFLANGEALRGLAKLVSDSGAQLVGAGIVIEKAFQPGGDNLRAEGMRVESLARVSAMSETDGITFVD